MIDRAPPATTLDVLHLLASAPPQALASAFAAVVGPLAAHDRSTGGDLVRTLRTYAACGGNALETAHLLGMHRNTILHRLTRINQLLGVDVRQPDTLFQVYAALRAGDYLPAGGPDIRGEP